MLEESCPGGGSLFSLQSRESGMCDSFVLGDDLLRISYSCGIAALGLLAFSTAQRSLREEAFSLPFDVPSPRKTLSESE